MTGSYPQTRLRRARSTAWSRALHRETVLTPADLIWPLFVTEGEGVEEPIATLPGVSRWSLDGIAARARGSRRARHSVPRAVPQHPARAAQSRCARGEQHRQPDVPRDQDDPRRLRQRYRRAHRRRARSYTSHGQDGLVDAAGPVLNDATVELLVEQALVQAAAGADIVAPRT